MKSYLVIGMGRFGQYLATKLYELGNDVMVVDNDEKQINKIATVFTEAFTGDCTNESVIKAIGVEAFDVCFVTTGDNFQSSLEITSLLKEHGAKYIVSKASDGMQAKFLTQIGANEVVYPEREMAERLATRFNADNLFDYVEINSELAIYELSIPTRWIGKTILEVNVRKNYNLNIIAIKKDSSTIASPGANYLFAKDDHIMVLGKTHDKSLEEFSE